MGYCPFEHKAGRWGARRARRRRAVREAQARCTGGAGVRHGAWHNAQGLVRGAATPKPGAATRPTGLPRHGHCERLGMLAGLCVCTLCT